MIKLNHTTKKAKNFIRRYFNSGYYTLNDCYNNYSYKKQKAYDYCISKMLQMGGENGCIIGFNSCFFTYAFQADTKLIVICPVNEYEIDLEY